MPKRTRDERIRRGRGARTLLDSEPFQNAMEDVRERIVDTLLRTNLDESDKREKLFMQIKGLDLVVGELQRSVKDETIERIRVDEEAKKTAQIAPIEL